MHHVRSINNSRTLIIQKYLASPTMRNGWYGFLSNSIPQISLFEVKLVYNSPGFMHQLFQIPVELDMSWRITKYLKTKQDHKGFYFVSLNNQAIPVQS